ncbi:MULTISPECIES: hypothetical protein [unclassified Crossiella]|uniref:hypothetical protein n=1 Tax=unclassified Crossiella TaxID=2620835 RepID=UPI001FFE6D3A|nr:MULTISPECIES: hypothetical protein [unclassified Crossiella]MCK2240050.1 hypothetical protein [Crossiella sp. S99.2]MCK2252758.1 hypothetical protein [Crossiella sp. S99.1]
MANTSASTPSRVRNTPTTAAGEDPRTQAARRLTALAENLGLLPEDLDDTVHDQASRPATAINNGGLDAQIFYLVEQMGEAETEQAIRELAEEPDPVRGLDTSLCGSMAEGYDNDLVNKVLGHLSTLGQRLVCVWNLHDQFGFGGDSNFYVETASGRLHELAGGLWQWLNGDPDALEPPPTPAPPAAWLGADTGTVTADLARHDDLHNYAKQDLALGDGSA